MARKPAKPVQPPRRCKLTVSLDVETARVLRSFSSYHGLDVCDVVARAVGREVAGFVVYQRAEPTAGTVGPVAPRTDTALPVILRTG